MPTHLNLLGKHANSSSPEKGQVIVNRTNFTAGTNLATTLDTNQGRLPSSPFAVAVSLPPTGSAAANLLSGDDAVTACQPTLSPHELPRFYPSAFIPSDVIPSKHLPNQAKPNFGTDENPVLSCNVSTLGFDPSPADWPTRRISPRFRCVAW